VSRNPGLLARFDYQISANEWVTDTENSYSFISQSMASSRVSNVGNSRCEKFLKFS